MSKNLGWQKESGCHKSNVKILTQCISQSINVEMAWGKKQKDIILYNTSSKILARLWRNVISFVPSWVRIMRMSWKERGSHLSKLVHYILYVYKMPCIPRCNISEFHSLGVRRAGVMRALSSRLSAQPPFNNWYGHALRAVLIIALSLRFGWDR